jgi:hypothetical protein
LKTTEPETHFTLVRTHIRELRQIPEFQFSVIQIFVERNLGFEAEHFERALQCEENVVFYRDEQACRTGILTTESVKMAAMTMTNVMLREQRVSLLTEDKLVSRDPQEIRRKLREQLEIYSMQFKTADTVFQKNRCALSGKVGGFKDDIVICLQLGIYWTETARLLESMI